MILYNRSAVEFLQSKRNKSEKVNDENNAEETESKFEIENEKSENIQNDIQPKGNEEEDQQNRPTKTEQESKDKENTPKDMGNEAKRKKGRPRLMRTGKKGRPKKQFNFESQCNEKEQSDIKKQLEDNASTGNEDFLICENTPESIADVHASSEREEWEKAILDELIAHKQNETWEVVERPKESEILKCRWVFTNKFDSEGKLIKRKARLVAKGCAQRPGIDFKETYAPVERQGTIRLLIAIAAKYNLFLHQFDINTAYLNGKLQEDIYMTIPAYYHEFIEKKSSKNKVCKLK